MPRSDRLLVVTQAVDESDPVLGFFHAWIAGLAREFASVDVICLAEGRHALPANVRVHTLGKERGRPTFGALAYAFRFLRLAWRLRGAYHAVFVHMNQEYVLLAGPYWRLAGKRVSLWRNHYAGSFATRLAGKLAHQVFYTSARSYTASFPNARRMPVGVDTSRFSPDARVARTPRSILFLARMSRAKRPDLLLEALEMLTERRIAFTADFVGSPPPRDAAWYEALRARAAALAGAVTFSPAVDNEAAADLYRAHEIFVNASPSGMLDKTIFEAAACGTLVLAASEDYAAMAGPEYRFRTNSELADRLAAVLDAGGRGTVPAFVERENLEALMRALAGAL